MPALLSSAKGVVYAVLAAPVCLDLSRLLGCQYTVWHLAAWRERNSRLRQTPATFDVRRTDEQQWWHHVVDHATGVLALSRLSRSRTTF